MQETVIKGVKAIAIGDEAGNLNQGTGSIAIGMNAGHNELGEYSISIGTHTNTDKGQPYTLTINATNKPLKAHQPYGCYVKPIREDNDLDNKFVMMYEPKSGEVMYNRLEKYGVGPTGMSGPSGEKGERGRRGSRGPTGSQGVQGIQGNTGATGPLKIGEFQGDYFYWDGKQHKWSCGNRNVNLGEFSGYLDQSTGCVAIGTKAGYVKQGTGGIAIGEMAGQTSQGNGGIAIGKNSGVKNQKDGGIAIGSNAGQVKQGQNSIAIGTLAGNKNMNSNSICINASGEVLNTKQSNSLHIKPIRKQDAELILCYNTITGEITYSDILTRIQNDLEMLKSK